MDGRVSTCIKASWNFLRHCRTPLPGILVVARNSELTTLNLCIWKSNFGVNTTKKFVISHYHILRSAKKHANPTFNTYCRFGPQERLTNGRPLLYQDLEDVFVINKTYLPGRKKNLNKLPEKLLEKIILYSSNPHDTV